MKLLHLVFLVRHPRAMILCESCDGHAGLPGYPSSSRVRKSFGVGGGIYPPWTQSPTWRLECAWVIAAVCGVTYRQSRPSNNSHQAGDCPVVLVTTLNSRVTINDLVPYRTLTSWDALKNHLHGQTVGFLFLLTLFFFVVVVCNYYLVWIFWSFHFFFIPLSWPFFLLCISFTKNSRLVAAPDCSFLRLMRTGLTGSVAIFLLVGRRLAIGRERERERTGELFLAYFLHTFRMSERGSYPARHPRLFLLWSFQS